jgi:sulfur-carrier protein
METSPSFFQGDYMVEVRMFATFRDGREKIYFIEHEQGMTGNSLCHQFNIDPNEVAIFLIKGQHRKLDCEVPDNSIVSFFPPVGGG